MTIKALYPTINPTLNLDFANTKTLGPLVTFTRASSGTFTDSAGVIQTAAADVPRFDHDPTTGESLGLLVEEQRTNLLLQSEELGTTWTTIRASISADTINSPNGTLTADKFIDTAESNTHVVSQAVTLADSTDYALSVFLKADQLSIVRLQVTNKAGTACLAYFDLLTGAVSNESNATGLISPFQNGWYRCTLLLASATGATAQQVLIGPAKTAGSPSYLGNGTDGLFIWGAQLEAGAFPTSYIPTTTATATRSADVASITGSAFTSFYNQSEGTVFAEYIIPALGLGTITSFDDGTVNNRWQQRFTATNHRHRIQSGGVNQVDQLGAQPPQLNIANKAAYALKSGDQFFTANGSLGVANSAATLPSITQLQFATGPATDVLGRTTIRRLCYWPQRLANSTLQTLTQ